MVRLPPGLLRERAKGLRSLGQKSLDRLLGSKKGGAQLTVAICFFRGKKKSHTHGQVGQGLNEHRGRRYSNKKVFLFFPFLFLGGRLS